MWWLRQVTSQTLLCEQTAVNTLDLSKDRQSCSRFSTRYMAQMHVSGIFHSRYLLGRQNHISLLSEQTLLANVRKVLKSSPLVFHNEPNGKTDVFVLLIWTVLHLRSHLLFSALNMLQGMLNQVPNGPMLGWVQSLNMLQDVQNLQQPNQRDRFRTSLYSSPTLTNIYCVSAQA